MATKSGLDSHDEDHLSEVSQFYALFYEYCDCELAGREARTEGNLKGGSIVKADRYLRRDTSSKSDRALGLQMLACLSAAMANRPNAPPAL